MARYTIEGVWNAGLFLPGQVSLHVAAHRRGQEVLCSLWLKRYV
jgi:hypothetical protein